MKKVLFTSLIYLLIFTCPAQYMYTNLTNDVSVTSMVQQGPYLWFTSTGGFFRCDTINRSVERFDLTNTTMDGDQFSTVTLGGTGKKLMTQYSQAFQTYDDFSGWSQPLNIDQAVGAVQDSKERIWIACANRLYFFDGNTWQYLTQVSGVDIGNATQLLTVDNNYKTCWDYCSDQNKLLKCDSDNHWSTYTVPGFQGNLLSVNHTNTYTNTVYSNNSSFYILNQPAGYSNAPAFLKMTNGSWNSFHCPLITDINDYLIRIQFMPNGDIKIPHGYVNELTGNYFYGVYVLSGGTWSEEFHISGLVPFALDSTAEGSVFMDADAGNNMYYCYGSELRNHTQPAYSHLWKLTSGNHWVKLNISNAPSLASNLDALSHIAIDTADVINILYDTKLIRLLPNDSIYSSTLPVCLDSFIVTDAVIDSYNNLWVLGDVLNHPSFNSYLINEANCIIYPSEGKWFSHLTYNNGVFYTLAQDAQNIKYLGIFDGNTLSYFPYTQPETNWEFDQLFAAKASVYGLEGGAGTDIVFLYYWIDDEWQRALPDSIQANSGVRAIALDTSNNLWVLLQNYSSNSAALYMFNGTSWFTKRIFTDAAYSSMAMSIDKHNVVSINLNSGIYQYHEGTWAHFPPPPTTYFPVASMLNRRDSSIVLQMFQDGLVIFRNTGIPPAGPSVNTSNLISGIAFYDLNNNGVQDSTEPPVPGVMISDGDNFYVTGIDGRYALYADSGSQAVTLQAQNYIYALPGDTQIVSFPTANQNIDSTVNFACHRRTNVQDLSVEITTACLVPGDSATYWVNINNNGTIPVNGEIVFHFDSTLIFLSVNGLQPSSITADSLVWNFPNILPSNWSPTSVIFLVSPSDTINQRINASAVIYPIAGDFNPSDNNDSIVSYVVSSYDPNEKQVFPATNVDTSSALTYTVIFQNTGNYMAANVVVSDTLDSHLDVSTLKILAASNVYTWSLQNRVLTIRLNHINLPQKSVSAALSQGFIKYNIKPLPNTLGNEIKNTASIFFDYNAPVQTNTTENLVTLPAFILSPTTEKPLYLSLGPFRLVTYPNPTSHNLNFRFSNTPTNTYTIRMSDITGKEILRIEDTSLETTIDCSTLSAGIYTYEVILQGYKATGKIVVQQ